VDRERRRHLSIIEKKSGRELVDQRTARLRPIPLRAVRQTTVRRLPRGLQSPGECLCGIAANASWDVRADLPAGPCPTPTPVPRYRNDPRSRTARAKTPCCAPDAGGLIGPESPPPSPCPPTRRGSRLPFSSTTNVRITGRSGSFYSPSTPAAAVPPRGLGRGVDPAKGLRRPAPIAPTATSTRAP